MSVNQETTSPGEKTKWLENTKNTLEILAILSAGIWALYVFILKDYPNLNKSFKVTSNVKVDEFVYVNGKTDTAYKNKCDLNYRIDIKNISYKDLYIDTIIIKAWQVNIDSIGVEKYLNFAGLFGDTNLPKVTDLTFAENSSGLISYYPPDTDNGEDFDFKVPVDYNKAIMVGHILIGHSKTGYLWWKKEERFNIFGYSWKLQCIADKENGVKKKENK